MVSESLQDPSPSIFIGALAIFTLAALYNHHINEGEPIPEPILAYRYNVRSLVRFYSASAARGCCVIVGIGAVFGR